MKDSYLDIDGLKVELRVPVEGAEDSADMPATQCLSREQEIALIKWLEKHHGWTWVPSRCKMIPKVKGRPRPTGYFLELFEKEHCCIHPDGYIQTLYRRYQSWASKMVEKVRSSRAFKCFNTRLMPVPVAFCLVWFSFELTNWTQIGRWPHFDWISYCLLPVLLGVWGLLNLHPKKIWYFRYSPKFWPVMGWCLLILACLALGVGQMPSEKSFFAPFGGSAFDLSVHSLPYYLPSLVGGFALTLLIWILPLVSLVGSLAAVLWLVPWTYKWLKS